MGVGATIGFVAVVESVVQGLWAWGSQWLIQTNIAAWLQGGIPKLVDRRAAEQSMGSMSGGGPFGRARRRRPSSPATSSSPTLVPWRPWPGW